MRLKCHFFIAEQRLKAYFSMNFNEEGKNIYVTDDQFSKAEEIIVSIEQG